MSFLPKSLSRFAIIALAVTGVAMTAVPAQAAPQLGGSLQLDAPIAPQVQQEGGAQMQMKKFGGDDDYDYEDYDWCLKNKQIRKGLQYAGFDDIDFVKELKHNRVRVEALYEDDGWAGFIRCASTAATAKSTRSSRSTTQAISTSISDRLPIALSGRPEDSPPTGFPLSCRPCRLNGG
jgi:hypothetical protein